MKSYEERLNSFSNFTKKSDTLTPEKFASAFFFAETDGSCFCELCQKNLDGWVKGDIPAKEHYLHNKECSLFHLYDSCSREKTFNGQAQTIFTQEEITRLVKNGFFNYRIKKKSRYDLFCYKCGYYINDSTGLDNIEHYCDIKLKKEQHIYSYKRRNSAFYIKLINGIYADMLRAFCENNIYIPMNTKIILQDLILFDVGKRLFEKTENVLHERVESLCVSAEFEIQNEINKILKIFDAKIELKYKEVLDARGNKQK